MWLKYVKFMYDLRRTNQQTLTILTNQIIIYRTGAQNPSETLAFKSYPVQYLKWTLPTNSMYKTAKKNTVPDRSQITAIKIPNKLKAVSPTPTAQFPAANCQYFLLALHQIVQITVDQHFHRPFIHPRFPSQRTQRIFESDKSELLHSQAVLPFGNPKINHVAPFAKDFTHDFTGVWADCIFENAPNQTTSVDGCRCPGAQFPNDSSLRGSVCNDSRDSRTSRVKSRSFHYLQNRLALQVHVFWQRSWMIILLSVSLSGYKLNRQECQCCSKPKLIASLPSDTLFVGLANQKNMQLW